MGRTFTREEQKRRPKIAASSPEWGTSTARWSNAAKTSTRAVEVKHVRRKNVE